MATLAQADAVLRNERGSTAPGSAAAVTRRGTLTRIAGRVLWHTPPMAAVQDHGPPTLVVERNGSRGLLTDAGDSLVWQSHVSADRWPYSSVTKRVSGHDIELAVGRDRVVFRVLSGDLESVLGRVATTLPASPVPLTPASVPGDIDDARSRGSAETDTPVSDHTVDLGTGPASHTELDVTTWRIETSWQGPMTLTAGRRYLLGRDPDASIMHGTIDGLLAVPDVSVSKGHALLEVDADAVRVSDLHSTNGTTIEDAFGRRRTVRTDHIESVRDGETVQFGDASVQFQRLRP